MAFGHGYLIIYLGLADIEYEWHLDTHEFKDYFVVYCKYPFVGSTIDLRKSFNVVCNLIQINSLLNHADLASPVLASRNQYFRLIAPFVRPMSIVRISFDNNVVDAPE